MVAVVNPVMAGGDNTSIIPIVQRNGSVASPLVTLTGTTGTAFTLPVVPTLPAGICQANTRLRLSATVQRTGANGTANLDVYLGTAGTTSDSRVERIAYAATTLQIVNLDVTVVFTSSATVATSLGKYATNTAGTDNQFGDVNTNINTAATMYLTLALNASNALDSFAIIQYKVWIEQ
jgi:hypothetical protein